jgi:hypothetical protein
MRSQKRRQKKSTPLTELRALLGSDIKPISVNKLGALVDIPPATLRSVETGRRSFNPELQKRMRSRGLEWDRVAKRWLFTYDHNADLSLYLLESLRRLRRGDAYTQKDDLESLVKRVTALLKHVADSAYTDLLLELDRSLEELLERYEIEEAKQVFQQTALKIEMVRTPSGSDHLVKSRSGPTGLADLNELFPVEAQVPEHASGKDAA